MATRLNTKVNLLIAAFVRLDSRVSKLSEDLSAMSQSITVDRRAVESVAARDQDQRRWNAYFENRVLVLERRVTDLENRPRPGRIA